MPSTSKPLSTATKVHREIPSELLWYERRGPQYLRFDRKGTFDNAGIGKLLYGLCVFVNIIYGFILTHLCFNKLLLSKEANLFFFRQQF